MTQDEKLPGIDELGAHMELENPRQAAWVLFQQDGSDLNPRERFGLLCFGLLKRLGYSEAHASFIVSKVLDWSIEELRSDRAAVIQLVDQHILTFFGDPTAGFYAWNLDTLKEAIQQEMPETPLISLAISLRQIALQSEEAEMLDISQLTIAKEGKS